MMKKLRQLITLAVMSFTVFSAGVAYASSFDFDPGGSGTGFASIHSCNQSCANIKNSLQVNIPNSGDTQEFYVFLDFRNASSGFISSPAGHLDIPSSGTSSSVTLNASLTGGGATTARDGVIVTNLPSSWEMEFVPGSESYVSIPVHPLRNDPQNRTCDTYYNKQFSYSGISFTNPQTVAIPTDANNSLPGLDYQYGSGWCQQGYVTYKLRVKNTTSNINPNPNPNPSNPQVDTLPASNIHQTTAYLNGKVIDGNDLDVYFVYGSSSQGLPTCSQTVRRVLVMGQYDAGQSFSKGVSGLNPGTTYYYRACATDGTQTDEGPLREFQTEQVQGWHWVADSWGACVNGVQHRNVRCVDNNGNEDVSQVNCDATTKPETVRNCSNTNTDLPEAATDTADDINTSSARLHGEVRMNSIDDGIVFFAYGESESRVKHVEDYTSYDSVPESGLNLQKTIVDNDDDVDAWKAYSKRVTGLREERDYYYRICVDYYYQHAHHLSCGNVKSFRTTEDSGVLGDVVIETLAPQSVGTTVAKLCGDLVDNGGNDSLLTWIEYRKAGSSDYSYTDKKARGEGEFCEIARNLTPGETYYYRACSEAGCASSRHFRTSTDVQEGEAPQVTTGVAYDIRPHSAKLPAIYVSHANRAVVYFKYGHSHTLTKQTRSYTEYGTHGEVVHPFTNLRANQYYCYQAVIETNYGKDEGAVRCFYTPKASGGGTVRPPKVITIIKDDKPDLNLDTLGLGLSFIQLDIDDNFDSVAKGQQVSYTVRWKNISKLNLRDLELNVEIPREVQIMGASRGLIDRDRNSVYYTIDRLDAGEEGSMTVSGVVVDGNVGDALTANATITFDNPVNKAKEDATDYDVDTFVLPVAGVNIGAGSLFGLGNVTFLGWLTILLGLFILFLIARWLYLEREDLRAQAYANRGGYYYPPQQEPHYPTRAPEAPVRERYEPSLRDVPSQRDVARGTGDEDPGYRPYRPRR